MSNTTGSQMCRQRLQEVLTRRRYNHKGSSGSYHCVFHSEQSTIWRAECKRFGLICRSDYRGEYRQGFAQAHLISKNPAAYLFRSFVLLEACNRMYISALCQLFFKGIRSVSNAQILTFSFPKTILWGHRSILALEDEI